MRRTLTLDITAAAIVITALVALVVYVLPDYLNRAENEPEPTPTITHITDHGAGLENMPCTLTASGC